MQFMQRGNDDDDDNYYYYYYYNACILYNLKQTIFASASLYPLTLLTSVQRM